MRENFETFDNMFIMMEVIQGGELFEHIKDYEISEKEACLIVNQVLEALEYLHMCGIVHRDLKPENIMVELDDSGETSEVHQVKLADFGLSKIIVPGEIMFESCGTPAYVAPEVLRKQGYQNEVDIWSTGVILYTMLARALPFHSQDKKQTFKLIKEADPDMTEAEVWGSISSECKDLINKMLIKNPKDRITVPEALKHPWFNNYKDYI
jgi:serine/threonine protein kinase